MQTSAQGKIVAGCASLGLFLLLCSACEANNRAEVNALNAAASVRPQSLATVPSRAPISLEEIKGELTSISRLSSFILFRGDKVILEHYAHGSRRDRPINIKSASKSLLNALVGIALQRGELESLDTPIASYLPKYFERIPAEDPRRGITIRHLLTLSSGLPSTSIYNYGAWVSSKDWISYSLDQDLLAEPGTRFTYSTGDTHLLAAVLTAASGVPLRTYAQRHLFDALGVVIGAWDRDPHGTYFGGNNVALSPEALLRFGRLYLDGGAFEGRQVLPGDWIEQSWRPRFINSSFNGRHDYGYLWWRADFGGHSTWFAWGYGGQFLFVIPSLDAVVVVTGDPDARSRGGNEVIYSLLDRTIVPYLTQSAS